MQKRVALITGVTGQDGSYLAEYLNFAWLCRAWYQAAGVVLQYVACGSFV
ncbi:GDP-D-mannose dehydratase [Bradyrhizobium sp. LB13.1]